MQRIAAPINHAATATAADRAAAAKHRQLVDAAGQFEAMLLGQMLKSSFGGGDSDDNGQENTDGATGAGADTMRGYGVEAVSRAIASAGGLGLRERIVNDVERQIGGRHAAGAA